MTFEELARVWMESQEQNVKAGLKQPSSFETNAHHLKALLAFFRDVDLGRVTTELVKDYQASRREHGRRPPTINSETATLKQVMRWAKERKLCVDTPTVARIPESRRYYELPTIAEVAALLPHLTPEHALLARVFAETGARSAEVYGLSRRDISIENATLVIRPSLHRGLKTPDSERVVPISPRLAQELVDAAKAATPTNPIFGGENSRLVRSFPSQLKDAVEAAGITRGGEPLAITPKTFRKAHATWQAERGIPESVLQQRLGHVLGSRITKRHYINPTATAARAAVLDLAET